jgi:hypothetical protein
VNFILSFASISSIILLCASCRVGINIGEGKEKVEKMKNEKKVGEERERERERSSTDERLTIMC